MKSQALYLFCTALFSGSFLQLCNASPVSSAASNILTPFNNADCLPSGDFCDKGKDLQCCSCSCLPSPEDADLPWMCSDKQLCTLNLSPPQDEAITHENGLEMSTRGVDAELNDATSAAHISLASDADADSHNCIPAGYSCNPIKDNGCCSCQCIFNIWFGYTCGGSNECDKAVEAREIQDATVSAPAVEDEKTDTTDIINTADTAITTTDASKKESVDPLSDASTEVQDTANDCIKPGGFCDPDNPRHCCSCQCIWTLFEGYICGGGNEC